MRVQARRIGRSRKGTNLIETGMGMLTFLMLLLGIMEYSRFIMYRQMLRHSAREGARLATTSTASKTTADIEGQVTTLLRGLGFAGTPTVQVYQSDRLGKNIGAWNNTKFGGQIAVRIDARYASILPGLGILPTTVNLRELCVMQSEAN